jgi:hypothetical protein
VKIVTANRGEKTKSCIVNEIVLQMQVTARLVNHHHGDTGNKQAAKQEELKRSRGCDEYRSRHAISK